MIPGFSIRGKTHHTIWIFLTFFFLSFFDNFFSNVLIQGEDSKRNTDTFKGAVTGTRIILEREFPGSQLQFHGIRSPQNHHQKIQVAKINSLFPVRIAYFCPAWCLRVMYWLILFFVSTLYKEEQCTSPVSETCLAHEVIAVICLYGHSCPDR